MKTSESKDFSLAYSIESLSIWIHFLSHFIHLRKIAWSGAFQSYLKAPELPIEDGLDRGTNILTNTLSHDQIDRNQKVQVWGNMVVEVPFSSPNLEETPLTLWRDTGCQMPVVRVHQ
jgi:hypothetical protein